MAAILNSAILDSTILLKLWLKLIQSDSNSFILTQLDDGSHLEFCHLDSTIFAKLWLKLIQSDSNSFILTQLADGSHLEFCHLAIVDSTILHKTLTQTNSFWLQTHSFSLNLMMAAILNSAILDSTILCKTLTQTNSIWIKLIHSLSTWWWQPSWILPSWIHPFCAKLWLKLIQSDSNSFILT